MDMRKNPLAITETSHEVLESRPLARKAKREETQAKFERIWHRFPLTFNPYRNAKEQERIKRSIELLKNSAEISGKKAVDLGAGWGEFSKLLTEYGAEVTAVDISALALKKISENAGSKVRLKQDYVPKTTLDDEEFDLVIALDLIAYLSPEDFRLFFIEMARLLKYNGRGLFSTAVDFRSEDSLKRFIELTETEFTVQKISVSHHMFFIVLRDFLKAPARFWKASKEKTYLEENLSKRHAFKRWWFYLNSFPILGIFWKVVSFLTNPLSSGMDKSKFCLLLLERVTRFFKNEKGISHVILLVKRKPLIPTLKPSEVPVERKTKKQLWE
jgi:2-polyprenyl-3-methyl-5-hydroxy-6-metoxy-1,4-benzoquinol methylase